MMTVLRNEGRWDRSNVCYAKGHVHLYDKRTPQAEMQFIDYGLSILRREVAEAVPSRTPFDLACLFHELSKSGQLAGFEVHERFYEVGSPDGLIELETLLTQRNSPNG
jgi:NDP-sugar pyrophosphorylase family protein